MANLADVALGAGGGLENSSAYNMCCISFQNHIPREKTLDITSALYLRLGSLSEESGLEYKRSRENRKSQVVGFDACRTAGQAVGLSVS